MIELCDFSMGDVVAELCYYAVLDSLPDVSLEIAGFLSGLGFDTSVAIRSKPLRLFDQVSTVIRLRIITFVPRSRIGI